MVDELFAAVALRVGVLDFGFCRVSEPIHADILDGLLSVLGDPGVHLDLGDRDSVLRLLDQQLLDEIVQRRVDHLARVLGLRRLNQAVELAVFAGDERVFTSGHVEEGDATGPDIVQPAAVHRADASLWRVKVSRACV